MNPARTPLTRCAYLRDDSRALAKLLENGADPDEPDGLGYRAIDHLTVDKWYVLIEFGADVNKALWMRPFYYIAGFREFYESGVSLSGAPPKFLEERCAVFELVLSIWGLPRGLALRVVEWTLKC